MSGVPFMQLYVGDYLADTRHLSTEEHGAYLLLLMTMWKAGGRLPNEPRKLARIACVSPKRWPKIWDVVGEFFTVEGGEITQGRLAKEFQKAVQISQKRKTAGSAGGLAKALKRNDVPLANAIATPKHSQISEPYTEANASDGAAVLFGRGVEFLMERGVSESHARSVIGKWRKEARNDDRVIDAFKAAKAEGAVDPVAFIERVLKPASVIPADEWDLLTKGYAQ